MYVEVMAATVGVCPVANKSGFAKNSRTETGTHSNPKMIMARCHTKPTNAYFFAPYAYSQHRMPIVSTVCLQSATYAYIQHRTLKQCRISCAMYQCEERKHPKKI